MAFVSAVSTRLRSDFVGKRSSSLCDVASYQVQLSTARVRCTAAGFGAKQTSRSWAEKYKAYVNRNGEMLCAMAWEGYERLGRGAVFANDDIEASSVAVMRPGGMENARASFYVDRDKLIERNENDMVPQMKPILNRIAKYDPNTQFVVVFEADGTQGADIVTPNMAPSEVWARSWVGNGKEKQKEDG